MRACVIASCSSHRLRVLTKPPPTLKRSKRKGQREKVTDDACMQAYLWISLNPPEYANILPILIYFSGISYTHCTYLPCQVFLFSFFTEFLFFVVVFFVLFSCVKVYTSAALPYVWYSCFNVLCLLENTSKKKKGSPTTTPTLPMPQKKYSEVKKYPNNILFTQINT